MSQNKVPQPDFKLAFLLPKYWLTWLGVVILYSISWLPYKFQLGLGRLLGRLLFKVGSKRKHIAEVNLKLSFPDMSEQKRQHILKKNFENTGIALFETGMGWWWPDWRVNRKVNIVGIEHIDKAQREGKGILLLAIHFLSAEMNVRAVGHGHPMVVFYRPHNNQLMEYFQFRGRAVQKNTCWVKKTLKV